ncbi:FecCD family ABC transporter permease [Deinococcus arenicola]
MLVLALLSSLALGASEISLVQVTRVLFAPDDSTDSLVVHALRLPRTLVAGLAGAALAVSGLLLQGVTRNPLADPGILGVEAGGAFAILVMVVAYLLGAATRAVQILFETRAQGALFALSGSVAGRTWEQLWQVAPWLGLGLVLAQGLASRVNVLALGEDVASSLGTRTARDSAIITALGVLLAAGSVSVVGPIGFVGLIIPHAARALMGADHRLSLPLAASLGAAFLILADIAARIIDKPAETPVGILVAAAGAPFFVLLARRIGRGRG